jgi:RNA polymerase sigma-70 factor, ECF subfamily
MREAEAETPSGIGDIAEIMNEALYSELRKRAKALLARERSQHRWDPADLVHEAFVRIAGGRTPVHLANRAHLMALANLIMRRVLIDHARSQHFTNRQEPLPLSTDLEAPGARATDAVPLHDALRRLAARDTRLYEIVKLRFFFGLGVEEIAEALSVSSRTIKRDWTVARVWLRAELSLSASTAVGRW